MSRETFHLEKRAVYAYRNFPFGYATGCTIVRALTSMTRFSHSAFNLSLPTEIVHIFRQFHPPPPPCSIPKKNAFLENVFFQRKNILRIFTLFNWCFLFTFCEGEKERQTAGLFIVITSIWLPAFGLSSSRSITLFSSKCWRVIGTNTPMDFRFEF